MKKNAALICAIYYFFFATGSAIAQEEGVLRETALQEEIRIGDVRHLDGQQALETQPQGSPIQETHLGSFQAEPMAEQEAQETAAPGEEPKPQDAPVQEAQQEKNVQSEPMIEQEAQESPAPAEAPVQEAQQGSYEAGPAVVQEPQVSASESEDTQAQGFLPGDESVVEKKSDQEEAQQVQESKGDSASLEEQQKEDLKKNAKIGDVQKQNLLDRIDELEKKINELTEESRARRKLQITEQEKQSKEKDVLEAVGREYSLDAKHTLGLDYTIPMAIHLATGSAAS